MPWQQHVLDVALEVADSGRLVYRHVGLSVPRQSGKSTLTLVLMTLRCMAFGVGQQVIYTAQDRMSAREKWEEDHVEKLRNASGIREGRDFTVRLSNGSERLRFANGSIWRISATMSSSGHGKTLDLAVIDEAFSHQDTRIDQSFSTPMITRPQPQLWVVSTAGTWESLYLNQRREAGRRAVADGVNRGVAWLEWSKPDDADFYDQSRWHEYMPAIGHTQTVEAIAAEIALMDPDDALRAFGNVTTAPAGSDVTHFDLEAWGRQMDTGSKIVGRCAFGIGVAPDSSRACIGVAGWRADGSLHVEHVEDRPGTTWLPERLVALAERWSPVAVGAFPSGPAGQLIARIDENLELTKVPVQAFAGACNTLHSMIVEGRGHHLGQSVLDEAVTAVQRRPSSDTWLWDLKAVDVSPLEAITAATAALMVAKDEAEAPSAYEERGFLDW